MRKMILAAILGVLIVFLIDHPLLAQTTTPKYPPPVFEQPSDSFTVQPAPVEAAVNLVKCAQDCLTNKFPLDMFGLGDGTLDGIPSTDACPRMQFFSGTSGEVVYEACIVLDVLSILKFPIIIGFAIRTIYFL
jgi:hypothetical protein